MEEEEGSLKNERHSMEEELLIHQELEEELRRNMNLLMKEEAEEEVLIRKHRKSKPISLLAKLRRKCRRLMFCAGGGAEAAQRSADQLASENGASKKKKKNHRRWRFLIRPRFWFRHRRSLHLWPSHWDLFPHHPHLPLQHHASRFRPGDGSRAIHVPRLHLHLHRKHLSDASGAHFRAVLPLPQDAQPSHPHHFVFQRLFFLKKGGDDSHRSSSKCVPKGFVAVNVGKDHQRFVIPVIDLNHPLFEGLLKEAEVEFGFKQEGALSIPCEVAEFKETRSRMKRDRYGRDPFDSQDDALEEEHLLRRVESLKGRGLS